MAIALQRSHKGEVTLVVNGQPASAAKFGGVQTFPEGQCAVFIVPLENVVFTEADNVLQFVRPAAVPTVFVGDPPAT